MNNKNPIFIHSLFRTGSTYLYSLFRSNKNNHCYYEPFHETLYNYPKSKAFAKNKQDTYKSMGHPEDTKDYFFEYPYNENGYGVPLFQKSFSYDTFCPNKDKNDDLKKYIENLINYAKGRPVFQFCRSGLRTEWLKKEFDSVNIYLVRDPHDQWMSYNSFSDNYFNIINLLILSKLDCEIFSNLRKTLKLNEYTNVDLAIEYRYYEFLTTGISKKLSYAIFYYLWVLSLIHNVKNSDCIIDLESLSHDLEEKNRVNNFLLSKDIEINFKDLKYKKYLDYDLTKDEFLEIENEINNHIQDFILLDNTNIDLSIVPSKIFNNYFYNFFNKKTKSISKFTDKIDNYQVILSMYDKFTDVYQHMKQLEKNVKEKDQQVQEKDQYIHHLHELVQSLRLKNRLKNITPKIIREKTYTLIQTTKRPLKLLKVMDKQYVNKLIKHIKQGNFSYILERMGHYLNQEPSTIHLDFIMSDYDREEVFTFPAVTLPKVSIVIPVYNQFDYTHKCLRSILEFTDDVDYEIIIADDVSSDETKDIHKYFKNIKVVRNEKNLGFLLNCNHAAKEAKGEYLFFLNNDTNVQENWLSTLLETIENDPTIGMIGSKLVYPDGRQQEAGGIIWNDAEGWNYGRLDNPEKPEYSYVKEVDYISGAAIMIRSKLWKEIGGFDERYVPAYYEDSDLAFEVREHGYKVVMHPKSLVVHFEGISNGTDTSTGMKKYQIVNHKKFYEKWEDVLKAENATHGENLFLARDRSADKKHILIIDHYVPHYDQDAGSRTMWQYLFMLKELDYQITFVGDNFYKHEPYSSLLENAGIEILYGSYYFNNFQNWLQENGKYFDFVYLLRPHIAIKYIDDVKKYTSAKIFYNGTDFHFLRMQREYDISKNKKLLPEIKAIEKQEISLFKKSDCVLTISHYEKEYFKKRFPDWGVEVIPTFIYKEPFPLSINNDFSKREGILFVGGFVHPPNLEGVKWFLKDIWPYILSKHPSMKFYIVGSNMPNEIKAMENENIIIKGFVEEDELSHLYNTVKIVVAPLTFGAGVKGKIIESICHGVPTVTTNTGAEGIIDIDKILLVNDDPLEFANTVNSLYNDVQQCQNIRTEQILYAQKHFSSDSAKNVLEQIFKKE